MMPNVISYGSQSQYISSECQDGNNTIFPITVLLSKVQTAMNSMCPSRLNVTIVGLSSIETSTCLFFTVPSRTVRRCNQQKETMKQEFVFCNLILSLCLRGLCFFLLTFQFFLNPNQLLWPKHSAFVCALVQQPHEKRTSSRHTEIHTYLPQSRPRRDFFSWSCLIFKMTKCFRSHRCHSGSLLSVWGVSARLPLRSSVQCLSHTRTLSQDP